MLFWMLTASTPQSAHVTKTNLGQQIPRQSSTKENIPTLLINGKAWISGAEVGDE
jgi:hypothetical protein